jgi:glycosyltransferase involved in cell wall biosynthesis
MNPYLTIIIPTFNRVDKLKICLEKLYVQNLAKSSFEIIVVNDGSTDKTKEFLNQEEAKNSLRVIHQENQGQGIARNNAISKAKGQILLFIGDDIFASPHFLSEHVQFHQENPNSKAVCLGLTEWEGQANRYMKWLTHGGPQFAYHKLKANEEAAFWFFYTSNISLKKELIGKDRFSKDFKGYGWEDIEFAYRLKKKGLKTIFNPKAYATHDHHMKAKDLEKKMKSIAINSKVFDRLHPELNILPSRKKQNIIKLINLFKAPLYLIKREWFWTIQSKHFLIKHL